MENKHDNSHVSELLFELSGDELRGSKVLENSLPALTMRIKGINPSYFLNKETMRSIKTLEWRSTVVFPIQRKI